MTQFLGDAILQLPNNNIENTKEELDIVNSLFKQKIYNPVLISEIKDIVVLVVLYVLISSEQFGNVLCNLSPALNNSPIILLFVRGVILSLIYWIVKHRILSRSEQ